MKQFTVYVAVCLLAVLALSVMGCGGGKKEGYDPETHETRKVMR